MAWSHAASYLATSSPRDTNTVTRSVSRHLPCVVAPSDSAREDLGHAGPALKAEPVSPPVARSYEEAFYREGGTHVSDSLLCIRGFAGRLYYLAIEVGSDGWRRRLQTTVFSATPPAEVRPPNGHEDGLPVEDGPETRRLAGCERGVEENRLVQDGGVISPPRTEDKKLAVTSRTEYCKHAGCFRALRYGRKNGPLMLCQSHKRAGLYTVRDGVLLVATRDGSGRSSEGSYTWMESRLRKARAASGALSVKVTFLT
ncbi:unnamed protein product [Ectocarpus sp. CCAP 1310/34]|nr:unnamed protein product [Ectocarpus sp. CCAP 1310/34]